MNGQKMNDDGDPKGAERGGGKTMQGVKTKSRVCHSHHGLPSCRATRPSNNCSQRKKKTHCSAHHLTAAPPKQHPHLQNSELTHRGDARGVWWGGKYSKFCCLYIHRSSAAPPLQLHPSPPEPPHPHTHTHSAATQRVTFSGGDAWTRTGRELGWNDRDGIWKDGHRKCLKVFCCARPHFESKSNL